MIVKFMFRLMSFKFECFVFDYLIIPFLHSINSKDQQNYFIVKNQSFFANISKISKNYFHFWVSFNYLLKLLLNLK